MKPLLTLLGLVLLLVVMYLLTRAHDRAEDQRMAMEDGL